MTPRFDLSRGFISSKKYKRNVYCNQADSLQKTLENVIIFVECKQTHTSSLVVTIDQKRKQRHLFFKAICGLKTSNCGKYLIFLVTVLFIREEWIRLLTLLKTGLLREISSEKLLQISKNTFQH